MKKIIVIILIFIVFIPSFLFSLEVILFNNWNLDISNKLNSILWKNEKITLQTWNYFYKTNKFSKALEKYLEVKCEKNCLNYYHNLWNIYYKISQRNDENQNLENSVNAYQKALTYKKDIETQKNLEFVLSKLKFLNSQKSNSNTDKKDENSGIYSNLWTQNNSWNNQNNPLSKQQQVKIEEYIQELKQKELQNSSLNKNNSNQVSEYELKLNQDYNW